MVHTAKKKKEYFLMMKSGGKWFTQAGFYNHWWGSGEGKIEPMDGKEFGQIKLEMSRYPATGNMKIVEADTGNVVWEH